MINPVLVPVGTNRIEYLYSGRAVWAEAVLFKHIVSVNVADPLPKIISPPE
jgi:hypothetical protein